MHEVIDLTLNSTLLADAKDGYHGAIQRAATTSVLRGLMNLAANDNTSPDVQAVTMLKLEELREKLINRKETTNDISWKAHYHQTANQINTFLDDPASFSVPSAPYTPPGSPIGSGEDADRLLLQCDFGM